MSDLTRMKSSKMSYRIDGLFFVITFTDPQTLNSLSGTDFLYLGHLLEIADRCESTYFTVLQSTGRFFSSGADVSNIEKAQAEGKAQPSGMLGKWLSEFVSRNLFVTHTFATHSKVLVCCLNGPAVGLTAAIVMLCDIVFSMNDKVYLLFPFANLALVTEGALSVTLPLKLGYNTANDILMFAKPVKFDKLIERVIVRNYNLTDAETFNAQVLTDLREMTSGLYPQSFTGIKKLLKRSLDTQMKRANVEEVNDALAFWVEGLPQQRFREIGSKKRKHKL
ncbi:dodecenoyl-CoA isomerase [Lachancea thermotolerans CBS 6340]|uniref:KLTH0G15114p n=1 Tax=Lachancea thermotolerans (strain ATCC 56472 / CBS 6340 / NRRL Y-8284) TaxID=559295 RepID=C5DN92_LACTC|nr:KLTH0G15114p [Lachancea thermotolerans CBS 6340]CAR25253.1 KLTH0G15114p [Lachancea thermotolerans CBS 6340]